MISVIVPCYNAGGSIEACIKGLQQQTLADFEVLLVDDGSTDGTAELAASLTADDTRFRLLRKEHQGVSAARNAGLAAAQGEYICFVDADDEISPNYLQALYEDAQQGDVDLVVHGLTHVFADRSVDIAVGQEGRFVLPQDAQRFFLAFDACTMGSVCSKLFRASVVRENRLLFCPEVYMCEDQEFVLRYLCAARCVRLSKQVNYLHIAKPKSGSVTYRTYTDEAKSYDVIQATWKRLMLGYPCSALRRHYGSFVGNFLHRVLYTALKHPAGNSSRKEYLVDFEARYTEQYRSHYVPDTNYTKLLAFCLLHRGYGAFKLAQRLAEMRYRIEVRFV